MAYNPITEGKHYFGFVEIAGSKYGLVLQKTGNEMGFDNYWIQIAKGDDWNTPVPVNGYIATQGLDSLTQTEDPYVFIQRKVDALNTQLKTYFTNAQPGDPANTGNGVPVTWQDKIEDALRHMLLQIVNGAAQIGKLQ
jgi:hypothetical protein